MRAWRMRGLYGDAQRPDGALLSALCRSDRRRGDYHNRGHWHGRDAPSLTAGISATPCAAMRLLHAGDDLGGPRTAARQCRSERRGNTYRPERQSLHVHRLRQYRARGARRCAKRTAEMILLIAPRRQENQKSALHPPLPKGEKGDLKTFEPFAPFARVTLIS